MFENTSELAPDLEWMLTSGQVDEATLIDHLIRAHYSELFQLALELNGYAPHAHSFTQQTLASAVLQAHQYKGLTSVRVWLFRLAVRVFSRSNQHKGDNPITSLPVDLPEMLTRQFYFNQEEVSAILDEREVGTTPREYIPPLAPDSDMLSPTSSSPTSSNSIGMIAQPETESDPSLSEAEIANITASIQGLIAQKRRVQTKRLRLQGLLLFASLLVLVAMLSRSYPLIFSTLREETPIPFSAVLMTEAAWVEISATPEPTPTATPLPPYLVVYQSSGGEILEDVARKYGVNKSHLNNLNSLPQGEILSPGQQVIIGMGSSRFTWTTTPVPFTPPDLPQPLSLESTTEQIQRRVAESRRYWHTLWAEVQDSYFVAANYIGPPRVRLFQTWIDQTINSTLTLTGDLSGDLSLYDLRTDISAHQYNFESEERQSSTQLGFYYAFFHEIHNFLAPGGLRGDLGMPANLTVVDQLELVGMDHLAGREALVVDWSSTFSDYLNENEPSEVRDHGRFWIDTQRGVILRHQQFHSGEERLLQRDTLVREIVFDEVFPYELFEPYRQLPRRFAKDHQGEPLPQDAVLHMLMPDPLPLQTPPPQQPPPPDFDPANEQLLFHYKPDKGVLDVYADGHHLGGVKTPDARDAICRRSSNGFLIALASSPWDGIDGHSWFYWFDLRDLHPDSINLPEFATHFQTRITNFAFSPDNRSLAFYGCAGEGACAISLIDLESKEVRMVYRMPYASALNWSPDGNYLAWLGRVAGATHTRLKAMVIDLRDGNLIYSEDVDSDSGLPAADSPTHEWSTPFTIRDLTLDSCAAPPR
jgi:LysM repeat protein